jgi:GMC oxidoreductase
MWFSWHQTLMVRLFRKTYLCNSCISSNFTLTNLLGPRMNVTATKEVSLSAGAIGTPQTLLLSGIGPKADLDALNIDVVIDSPAVGLNLTDQPATRVVYNVASVQTFTDVQRNSTLADQFMQQWTENRTGLYVNYPGSIVGNFKLPSPFEDHSSGPGSANIGFVTVVSHLWQHVLVSQQSIHFLLLV